MANQRVEVLRSQLAPYNTLPLSHRDELKQTISRMTAPGKGLLAADESVGSVTKRFKGIKLENNAENRRQYRALMIGAAGIEQYISGVIFHSETLGQKMDDGSTFPEYLTKLGVVPGVKTDMGLMPFYEGAEREQQTQGLDNYVARAGEYYRQGARFCKWRNVYIIQNGTVSEALVRWNAETLARYAVLSLMAGLVPIVEPEVMIDGNHTIEQSQSVSERVWAEVAAALHRHGVPLELCLLKPNMVVPGAESGRTASPDEVAVATLTALSRTIPAALPGITFLSGGLSETQASAYLNAINRNPRNIPKPWNVSFSYARALQSSALAAWGGKKEGMERGRKAFLHRAKMNSLAQLGQYRAEADDAQSASLYIKGNTY